MSPRWPVGYVSRLVCPTCGGPKAFQAKGCRGCRPATAEETNAYGYVTVPDKSRGRKPCGSLRRKLVHRRIVESVIGRPLPRSAVVHHVDGDRTNNNNDNLVVCENNAYHILIETRTRAFRAIGKAYYRKCNNCGQWDHPDNLLFYKRSTAVQHRRKDGVCIVEESVCR